MGKWFNFNSEITKYKPSGGIRKKDPSMFRPYSIPSNWRLVYLASNGSLPSASTPAWTNTGTQSASMTGGVLTVTDNSTTQVRWWKLDPPNNWNRNHKIAIFEAEVKWTSKPTQSDISSGTVFVTRNSSKYLGVRISNDTITVCNKYTIEFKKSTQYHKYSIIRDNNDVFFYIDGVFIAKYLYNDLPSSSTTYLHIGAGSPAGKETKVYKNMKAWWM